MAGKYAYILVKMLKIFNSKLFFFFFHFPPRTFWRHFLLPSTHQPDGNGLTFETIHTITCDDWP